MRATCAWCADEGDAAAGPGAAPRSHGLCRACLEARLEALRRAEPAPSPAGPQASQPDAA
jgi:hypothetical protein